MSYWRDTAQALAQRAPDNFIGVVLYVAMGDESASPRWRMSSFASADALEDWYEEIAPSAPLYYYLAAFDKTRGASPVGESIAPPKPGQPGFDTHLQWRHSPFRKPTTARRGHYGEARSVVGADAPRDPAGVAVPALMIGGTVLLLIAVLRDEARLGKGR